MGICIHALNINFSSFNGSHELVKERKVVVNDFRALK